MEPPKKPELAPFFLPTLPGPEPVFAPAPATDNMDVDNNTAKSRIMRFSDLDVKTKFIQLLEQDAEKGECEFQKILLFKIFYWHNFFI